MMKAAWLSSRGNNLWRTQNNTGEQKRGRESFIDSQEGHVI